MVQTRRSKPLLVEALGTATRIQTTTEAPNGMTRSRTTPPVNGPPRRRSSSPLRPPLSPTSPLDPISPWPPLEDDSSAAPHPSQDLPNPKEVYGLLAVLLTYLAFAVYLVWAFAPPSWLEAVGWTWYPDREWSVIVPCWLMLVVLLSYWGYAALTIFLTPSFDSPTCIIDEFSVVRPDPASDEPYYWKFAVSDAAPEAVDFPIDLVNRVLYPPRRRKQQ